MKAEGRRQATAARRAWVDGSYALALAMLVATSALAATEPDLMVTVLVYNYAGVSSKVLGDAEKEASRVFTAAGVD